jgi:uncharacterized protein YjiS (DUF1127 family)
MSDTTFIPTAPMQPRFGFGRILAEVRLMLERSRERQVLAALDARGLRDIGVTPYEAGVEARKAFWRT